MFIDMRQLIFQGTVDEDHFIDMYINFNDQCIECWLNKRKENTQNQYKGIAKKTVKFINGQLSENPVLLLHAMKKFMEEKKNEVDS